MSKEISTIQLDQSEKTERLPKNYRDGLIMKAKNINFDSSNDGDYHKYIGNTYSFI